MKQRWSCRFFYLMRLLDLIHTCHDYRTCIPLPDSHQTSSHLLRDYNASPRSGVVNCSVSRRHDSDSGFSVPSLMSFDV